jgi:hypothetical protein
VYASVTLTTGPNEDMAELAVMAGETMVEWLRQIDGFEGMLILTDDASGTTRVISLWASREVAERHREARMRLRDRITTTVDVRVEETVYYDVPFAWFPR